MPKRLRAELHERFAGWLEGKLGERVVEFEEILGYHLEQAYRYRVEFGASDEALARRAAGRLGPAGKRALDRGDMDGASNLLERAVALLEEDDATRIELEVELGEALLEGGRLTAAESLLEDTARRASGGGDELLHARAQVGLASVRIQTQGAQAHADIGRDVELLVTVFEEAEDHRGAADALRLLGVLARWADEFRTGSELQERAMLHARKAGDERREAAVVRHIVSGALWGPEPVELALARCRRILDETSSRRIQANCLVRIGGLEGLAGRFESARQMIARARATMADLGLSHLKAHSSDVAVLVEMLAGDYDAAEQEARAAYAVLEKMGDRTYQVTEAQLIANALEAQERDEEAEEWLALVEQLGAESDAACAATTRARIAARREALGEGERLARGALKQLGDPFVPVSCDPRFTLAEILAHAGRTDEAREEAEACLRRYDAKGIVPLAERARALLASQQPRTTLT